MDAMLKKLEKMDPEERTKLHKLLKDGKSEVSEMNWMYKANAPDRDEYLLGRRIDKHIENEDKVEEDKDTPGASFQEVMARRADMDMHAKMREDPLYAIRKKEEEAKKRLMQNPIRMKQLEKLMKEREKQLKKEKKKKKKKKHRRSSGSDDSDDEILNKYLAIIKHKSGKQPSESLSKSRSEHYDDANEEISHSGSKHGQEKHHRDERRESNSDNRDNRDSDKVRRKPNDDDHKGHKNYEGHSPKQYGLLVRGEASGTSSHRTNQSNFSTHRSHRSRSRERSHKTSRDQRSPHGRSRSPHRRSRSRSPRRSKYDTKDHPRKRSRSPVKPQRKKKMTPEEMARLRDEMQDNAKWRDEQRSENVKRYLAEDEKEDREHKNKGSSADFLNPMMMQHASNLSVEERIKRNIHNIQRTNADLDKNFTKR